MRKAFILLVALLLVGCSSGIGLLEKPEPAPVTKDALIRPPWQTLVRAGPGAEKDIDYETLDGVPQPPTDSGSPQPLAQSEQNAPPDAATSPPPPLPATDSQAKTAKPGTEISAVAVVPVSGVSPQGAKDLTAAMRKVLRDAGWPVLEKPAKNALTIAGDVKLDAAQGPNQAVHISWVITSPAGKTIGTVSQNNDVPAHSLDTAWGETAGMAAQAAADGIFKLIQQYR